MLRIAVRCFDDVGAVAKEARYKDIQGFSSGGMVPFDDITAGCTDFIAAAQWIRDNTVEQGQCSMGNVPACVPATQEALDEISNNLDLYSAILPAIPEFEDSCFAFGDLKTVELRNTSFTHAYRGVIAGRYICSQTSVPGNLVHCDDGAPPSGRPDRGMWGHISGFSLAPQSFASIQVVPDGEVGFDFCCDYDVGGETGGPSDCTADPAGCSPADVMCGNVAIFEICEDGFYDQCHTSDLNFKPLDRVVWLDPVLDVEPGDSLQSSGVSPSAFAGACLNFEFGSPDPQPPLDPFGPNRLGIDQETADFDFTPMVRRFGCQTPSSNLLDADHDGKFDRCEAVAGNLGPIGLHRFTLRQTVRNDEFFVTPFTADDVVEVGGVPAITELVSPGSPNHDVLEVLVDTPLMGPGVTELDIQWSNDGGQTFEDAPQDYLPRWFGYVSEGTNDGLLALDIYHAEDVTDDSNYVSLNCDPGITEVGSPWDLATRSVGGALVSEIYAVSDVTLAGGSTDSRLFGIDVSSHTLLSSQGVPLAGSGRAVYVANDQNGYSQAYVARKVSAGFMTTSTITVVNVDETNPVGLWDTKDGAAQVTIKGLPMGIRVHHFGPDTFAYVTSVECVKPLFSFPCPLSGCRDHRRNLWVSVVDVTNPATGMTLLASENIYSRAEVNCDSELLVSEYQNVGLEFTDDKSMLFIANPEGNRLDVLKVPENTLNSLPGTPVFVGLYPVDVAVVYRGGLSGPEMAYTVNRTDQSISAIEIWNNFNRLDDIQLGPGPMKYPVAIEARSDGMRLYTADRSDQAIGVFKLDNVLDRFVWLKDINTTFAPNEGLPRRLVLLRLPVSL